MTTTAIPSRLGRVKRRQGLAAAGAYRASEDPSRACVQAKQLLAPPGLQSFEVATSEEVEQYCSDFHTLLPVAARLFGYDGNDREAIAQAIFPAGVNLLEDRGRRMDLKLTIRAWMIELIVRDSGDQVPLELEYRARSVFRQYVMGEVTDENGLPYAGLWLENLGRKAEEVIRPS